FVTYRNARVQQAQAHPATPVDDVRIRLMAEELIGLRTLARRIPPARLSQNQERIVQQLDQAARSPNDQLHMAVIAGEFLGREEARTRLDALSTRPLAPELSADIETLREIYSGKAAALDPASRVRLSQRQDYFARVALSFGVASNVEPRKSLE